MTENRKQIYETLGFEQLPNEVKMIDKFYSFKDLHDTFRIVIIIYNSRCSLKQKRNIHKLLGLNEGDLQFYKNNEYATLQRPCYNLSHHHNC